MKKTLLLLLLAMLGYGGYFLYSNDADFRNFITAQLDKFRQPVATDSTALIAEPETDNKSIKKGKKRIGKKVKPDEFSALDKYARNTPKSYEKDITTLAQYLIKPAKNETEKARVLFTWVATHVHYDDDGYNKNEFGDCTAEGVLKTKKTVCEGYSSLLKALAVAAGMEAEKITGYAKGYSYMEGESFKKTNHAWNAIKIDGRWTLHDATWANGAGENRNGKMVSVTKFEPYWFNVNPKEFLFTHLPEHAQASFQLNETRISLAQYQNLPWLGEGFFKLQFNTDKVFNDAVSGRVKNFVYAYSSEYPIRALQMPYTGQLKKGEEVNFIIYSEYEEEIAVIDEGEWIYFTKDGNVFKLNYVPQGKEITIDTKINPFDKSFNCLVKYTVIDNGATAYNK